MSIVSTLFPLKFTIPPIRPLLTLYKASQRETTIKKVQVSHRIDHLHTCRLCSQLGPAWRDLGRSQLLMPARFCWALCARSRQILLQWDIWRFFLAHCEVAKPSIYVRINSALCGLWKGHYRRRIHLRRQNRQAVQN